MSVALVTQSKPGRALQVDRGWDYTCFSQAIMGLDPTDRGRQRWTNGWKAALNAFDIT